MSASKRVAKSLRISDSLSLPIDFATSRNMVLAQSGAGKSNVCVVLAESRADLADASNLTLSGTFDTYLSKLRGLELVEGKSEISLSGELVG